MKEQIEILLAKGAVQNFPASDRTLHSAITFAEEIMEKADCPMKAQMAINVALEEIFVNISHYAYGEKEGVLSLAIVIGDLPKGKAVILRFCDQGMPFDPLSHEDPDVSQSAEAREIGGLGIYMVKKMMDEVMYAYEDGENRLTIVKYLYGIA